jgi:hypothetical protein
LKFLKFVLFSQRNLGEKDAPKNAHMVIEWEDLDEESVKARRAANTSVTDESDLTALMALADLAGRDFTAERQNARVIFPGATCVGENKVTASDEMKLKSLPIPIRPHWTKEMSATQVDSNEKEAFLTWRRELARIEESYDVVLTPFEKNLEFWRQLWRVVEKSDVVVQVVDARNPMLYRCKALEEYVQQAGAWKGNVLLFNKADLLPRQAQFTCSFYKIKPHDPGPIQLLLCLQPPTSSTFYLINSSSSSCTATYDILERSHAEQIRTPILVVVQWW